MPIDKIAIILDTNSFISFKDNNLIKKVNDYDNFSKINYNKMVDKLFRFCKRNKLTNRVTVFVPEMVLLESINKQRKSYTQIIKFLESLSAPEIKIEINEVDYNKILKKELNSFRRNSQFKLISLPRKNILREIIDRSINESPPFNPTNSSSDKGFKDVVIWESILNSSLLKKYEEFFFLTRDGLFNDYCKSEFKRKYKKDMFTLDGESNFIILLQRLRKKFQINEELDEVKDFIETKIEISLMQDLDSKNILTYNGVDFEINSKQIIKKSCGNLEIIEEEETIYYLNLSQIKISCNNNKHFLVNVESKISMPPYCSIEEINYNYNLR